MKIENKKILITIIAIFIVVIILTAILNNKKEKKEYITNETEEHKSSYYSYKDENNGEVEAVTNRDDFFTVQACVNSYISYLNSKDSDTIYKLLDESYIREFNITPENVLDHVEKISGGDLTCNCRKMFFKKIGENEYEYYTTGDIIIHDTYGTEISGKINVTVKMDMNNMIFSVIPFGYGGMFYEEN